MMLPSIFSPVLLLQLLQAPIHRLRLAAARFAQQQQRLALLRDGDRRHRKQIRKKLSELIKQLFNNMEG